MIVVKLQGGLGNQLFQYACGLSLAQTAGTVLKLDLSWFENDMEYAHGIYYLEHFDTSAEVADQADIKSIIPFGRSGLRVAGRLYDIIPRLVQLTFNFYREQTRSEPTVLNSGPFMFYHHQELHGVSDCYLDGYWLSEEYFKPIEQLLREEFSLQSPPASRNASMAKRIEQTASVAVHIRRGDFLETNGRVLELPYYGSAVESIRTRVSEPTFFVFSDDIEWAKDNLRLENRTVFVSHNDYESCYEDLRLMAMCDHNIIANSTFSWWGAWLNDNPEKYVVAPEKWTPQVSASDTDIYPNSWQIVGSADE